MTVEFAVAFPVLIIVAAVAVNALLFFSECAAFDRVACDSIRTFAASPAFGQDSEESMALITQAIEGVFDRDYLTCSVGAQGGAGGHTTFTATLFFSPTLFGLGLKSEVFGVALPSLQHSVSLSVDTYRPGVLI